jgi:drug/metabolite transporter (DMT)-like permease
MPMTQRRAVFELCLAAMFWGLGFIATVWTLREAGPLAITGWRFLFAALVGLVVERRFFFSLNARPEMRDFIRSAWLPGLLIAATLIFQTWGLRYTTATKSSFLTCLYVLIVPMLEPFFGGNKPSPKIFLCSLAALVGVALMCGLFASENLEDKAKLNFGDLLTLFCALAASAHIIVIGNVHNRLGADFNGFDFNTAQSLTAGIPTLIVALAIEPGTLNLPVHLFDVIKIGDALPLIGFLSLTFCSTLIGFALQVRAQRVLSPSTASLLFLLESPFAALFAYFFLGEVMAPLQLVGGMIILAAVAYSSYATVRPAKLLSN